MWSLILYVVCSMYVCMCTYLVFCKIDHWCIHIHWCIVMGLGHNDPWVESHMWPQQTWGQRSFRGQWPLVQVFGKKGQCIHILWCIFKSNITMIAKVCDRESRRDTWFENRLVWYWSENCSYQTGKELQRQRTLSLEIPNFVWGLKCLWFFFIFLFYSYFYFYFYSILFYSILFYSILFYSILFYSILFCSILSWPSRNYLYIFLSRKKCTLSPRKLFGPTRAIEHY